MTEAKLVRAGAAAQLQNPLTKEIIKQFPILKAGFREELKAYIATFKIQVINAASFTWALD